MDYFCFGVDRFQSGGDEAAFKTDAKLGRMLACFYRSSASSYVEFS